MPGWDTRSRSPSMPLELADPWLTSPPQFVPTRAGTRALQSTYQRSDYPTHEFLALLPQGLETRSDRLEGVLSKLRVHRLVAQKQPERGGLARSLLKRLRVLFAAGRHFTD